MFVIQYKGVYSGFFYTVHVSSFTCDVSHGIVIFAELPDVISVVPFFDVSFSSCQFEDSVIVTSNNEERLGGHFLRQFVVHEDVLTLFFARLRNHILCFTFLFRSHSKFNASVLCLVNFEYPCICLRYVEVLTLFRCVQFLMIFCPDDILVFICCMVFYSIAVLNEETYMCRKCFRQGLAIKVEFAIVFDNKSVHLCG